MSTISPSSSTCILQLVFYNNAVYGAFEATQGRIHIARNYKLIMSKYAPSKPPVDKSSTRGDLVRIFHHLGNRDDPLSPMVDELIDPNPLVSSRWSVGTYHSNSWLCEYQNNAHIIALQLPCAGGCQVGVLKMGTSGHCTLFLRIKRGHVTKWASHNAVKEESVIALRRTMNINEGRKLLDESHSFRLTDGEVHHPHTLSILLCMTKLFWMKRGKHMSVPINMISFTVVAIPPPLVVIEKCLCLIGWKGTFLEDNKAASAKGIRAVNADVWGKGSKTMINANCTALFIQGTREMQKNIGRTLIAGIVPKLNQCAMKSDTVMRNMLKGRTCEIGDNTGLAVLVGNAADITPDSVHVPALVLPAGMKDIVAQSDFDSDDSDDVPLAVKNVFPVSKSPIAKSPIKAHSNPVKRYKVNGSEDEGDDINDVAIQDADLSDVDSTSEEDDDDDDDDDDESDENCDGDDDGASLCSRSSEGKEAQSRKRGRGLESPVALGAGRQAAPLPTGNLNAAESDPPLLQQALRAMVAPCCAHMKEWDKNSSEHSTQVDEQRKRCIRVDVDLLEKSTSVLDIVSTLTGLVSSLANSHTDSFKGETVTMNRKTLNELNTNRDINTADIDKAIQILGSVRDRVESPRLPQSNQDLHSIDK